jgi:hypothetical protein
MQRDNEEVLLRSTSTDEKWGKKKPLGRGWK